jgi:branched-chain amino acid transport system substrate-binding protein
VFGETFKSLGGEILGDIGFGRDVNEFTAIATRIASLGKADVIPTYTLKVKPCASRKPSRKVAQAGVTKGGGGSSIQLGTKQLSAYIWPATGIKGQR